MRNTIILFRIILLLTVLFAGNKSLKSQILQGVLKPTFEEITVSQRAIFSGEVQLNQGLWLNGRAQLRDGLSSVGGIDISGDIVFNNLSLVTDLAENALVIIDPQGNVRRMSGFEAIKNVIENRTIEFQGGISTPELSVLQSLRLVGSVDIGDNVLFRGDAIFADDVRISQDLDVANEIRSTTATIENLEVNESIRTTGLVVEGVIESAGLVTEGLINATGVVADRVDIDNTLRIGAMAFDSALGTAAFIGTNTTGELVRLSENQLRVVLDPVFAPEPRSCLVTSGGGTVPRWNYDVNKIVIDDCSKATANVGLGTLNPTAKLDVVGRTKTLELAVERDASVLNTLSIGKQYPTNTNNTYQLEVAGNVKIDWNQKDFSDKIDLSDGSESASLYLGDDEHVLRVHRKIGSTETVNPGVYLTTFNNAGLFLSEGGGMAVGGNSSNKTVDFAPEAALHVRGQGFSKELFLIETEAGNQAFKVKTDDSGIPITYAEEIVVQLAPFPDYVFKKDYKRLSLSETEKYINKNGRLPKMPSAETVAKDGANVGEIMNLLVEKVEELTLELIELDKKNKALEEKLNALQNEK